MFSNDEVGLVQDTLSQKVSELISSTFALMIHAQKNVNSQTSALCMDKFTLSKLQPMEEPSA